MHRTKAGSNGKRNGNVSVTIKGIGTLQPKRRKKPGDKRGRNPEFVAQKFKPGNEFWKKGKHGRKLPRFEQCYEVGLLDPVPEDLRKKMKLKKGMTMMQLVTDQVLRQAAQGSLAHTVELREVLQGRVANKNLNLSANVSKLIDDPEFLTFVEQCATQFLARQQGAINGRRTAVRELSSHIPADTEDDTIEG